MMTSSFYKGYEIDIHETKDDYRYVVKDQKGKIITESHHGWPFPTEAEMQAKLYINRIIMKDQGFIIT